MKVILMANVPKIGRKFDVVDVSDGHAMNMLIPRKYAIPATDKNLANVNAMKAESAAKEQINTKLLEANVKSLEGREAMIKAKANKEGHLFASIKAQDITDAIQQSVGVDIPAEMIVLEGSVKTTGEHTIKVSDGNITGSLKLVVEAE